MNDIFDCIPKARDIKMGINQATQTRIQGFVHRVAKVLENTDSAQTTLNAGKDGSLFTGIHASIITQAFRERGWNIQYKSDQRDGDYFVITMLPEINEGHGDS